MRQQIRDELARLDQEFKWVTIKSEYPDEFQLSHPDEKPEPLPEAVETDPLSPNRQPVEATLDIKEGQKGISYLKLFVPYLTGATEIRLVDPYIRYDYQIYNLLNFCEMIAPDQGNIKVYLVTGTDSDYQKQGLDATFKDIQNRLVQDRVLLNYEFSDIKHDRMIEADTGWRIVIGRGLDIFQKPEGKFSLGFADQTKRKCKETTITYVRKE